VISLMGHSKTSVSAVLLVPLVLMMVPLVDILQVMNKRLRDGYGIFIADKNHIHHRLMSLGFSVKGILIVIYGFTILVGSAGLLMLRLQPHESIAIFIILFSFSILTLLMITRLEKGENKIGIVFPFWITRKK